MKYPETLFVYCNENDDYSWDCNEQETWTNEAEYILQSEYDQLKAENDRLREALKYIEVNATCMTGLVIREVVQRALNKVMK